MMKFNKIIVAFAFALALNGHSNVYGSVDIEEDASRPGIPNVLEGKDTEAKVENAILRFVDCDPLDPDISDFVNLKDRGQDHLGKFKKARKLFFPVAEAVNGMDEGLSLMLEDFPGNKRAKNNINPVALMTTDRIDDKDFKDFNRGMTWSSLRLKFNILNGYNELRSKLEYAYEKHVDLKEKSLRRQYKSTVKILIPLQASYNNINKLYPDMPDEIDVGNVKIMELYDLKELVPQFKEAVEDYGAELTAAKKWQSTFTALRKKHSAFVVELEKIGAGFEALRDVNDENPELPFGDLDELDSLKKMGELEDMRSVLGAIGDQMKNHRVQLVEARKWRPEVSSEEEEVSSFEEASESSSVDDLLGAI